MTKKAELKSLKFFEARDFDTNFFRSYFIVSLILRSENNVIKIQNKGKTDTNLLEPVDADVIATKNKSQFPLKGDNPRFKFDVSVGDVRLRLSDRQHHQIYETVEKLHWFRRRQRYATGRPVTPIKNRGNDSELVKQWWNWAIKVGDLKLIFLLIIDGLKNYPKIKHIKIQLKNTIVDVQKNLSFNEFAISISTNVWY